MIRLIESGREMVIGWFLIAIILAFLISFIYVVIMPSIIESKRNYLIITGAGTVTGCLIIFLQIQVRFHDFVLLGLAIVHLVILILSAISLRNNKKRAEHQFQALQKTKQDREENKRNPK